MLRKTNYRVDWVTYLHGRVILGLEAGLEVGLLVLSDDVGALDGCKELGRHLGDGDILLDGTLVPAVAKKCPK